MGPALIGIIPYSGITFWTFDALKHEVRKRNINGEVSAFASMLCGGTAGKYT